MTETKETYGEPKGKKHLTEADFGNNVIFKDPVAVEIRAELRSVKTCVDHTVMVTLNLPEECIPQAKVLLGWIGNEVKAVIEVTK